MRVALDHYCGKCWYDHWDQKKGALKSMADSEVEGVLAVAARMQKEGVDFVSEINRNSLAFRGKKGPAVAKKGKK